VARGAGGLIAVGLGYTNPATVIWWVSPDGRRWQAAPTFAPLGPVACRAAFCALRPAGALVGDGDRLLALRGGPDATGWVSTEGRAWRPLTMSGDLPAGDALRATLLPGGVLLGDGSTSWYGQAVTR
jgi:hypothetical protein